MRNYKVSITNGQGGGSFERFFTFGGALRFAKENENEAVWVFIDNDVIGMDRYYQSRPNE